MSADSQSTFEPFQSFSSFLLVLKPASNKLGILEEDDEFEEFPVEGNKRAPNDDLIRF